jgi:hypothetical protein
MSAKFNIKIFVPFKVNSMVKLPDEVDMMLNVDDSPKTPEK